MGINNSSLSTYAGLAGATGSKTAFTYLALDSSSTAYAATQTALVSEITTVGLARAAATVSLVTTTVTDDTLQLYKQWTATGSVTVKGSGSFNAASAGTMGYRQVHATERAITSGNTYTLTAKLSFASA